MERMIPVVQTTLLDVTTEKPVRLTEEQFKALDELMMRHAITAAAVFGNETLKTEAAAGVTRARKAARRALTGGNQ